MKTKNTVIIIIGIASCALASPSRAACTQSCMDVSTPYGPENNIYWGTQAGGSGQWAEIGIGESALMSDTGSYNIAIGDYAMGSFGGGNSGSYNTAVGWGSLGNNRTGNGNTAFGFSTLGATDTGSENTAVGDNALVNYFGSENTAVGSLAMRGDDATQLPTGNNNTAVGANALYDGVSGDNNTAVGGNAMYGSTTVGSTGSNDTATGYDTLYSLTTGSSNVATGYSTLFFDTSGSFNTATGRGALYHNTTANNNVATGYQALNSNKTGTANTATGTQALQADTGSNNTADGYQALNKNTIGVDNVATGYQALLANTSGITNTAVGAFALENSQTGAGNIAIGFNAGTGVTSGGNNIDIANTGANESSTIRIGSSNQTNTYIAGINGVTVAGGLGVIIDSSGHLGTSTSSARFKEDIEPMDTASEALLALKPVTFRYKKGLDPKAIPQFGLVAEQVEKIDPDLVARDDQGRPYSVRYEAVNAMLLNEFLKEHRKVETQATKITKLESNFAEQRRDFEDRIARQQKQISELTTGLQKVSARLERTAAPVRVAADN
jgi:hypothetical protein